MLPRTPAGAASEQHGPILLSELPQSIQVRRIAEPVDGVEAF